MKPPLAFRFEDDGTIPNSRLPLLVYQGVLRERDGAAVQALFAQHGWGDGWINGIFSHHHYHSTAHEVLGVIAGWCEVQFGGPKTGRPVRAAAGDVVVVPAGVGHCNLGQGGGFACVGAYPAGQRPDLCRESTGDRGRALRQLAAVGLPAQDPVYGGDGPLFDAWRA